MTVKIQGDLKKKKLKKILKLFSVIKRVKKVSSHAKISKSFIEFIVPLRAVIVSFKVAREVDYLFTVKVKFNKFVHVILKSYSP